MNGVLKLHLSLWRGLKKKSSLPKNKYFLHYDLSKYSMFEQLKIFFKINRKSQMMPDCKVSTDDHIIFFILTLLKPDLFHGFLNIKKSVPNLTKFTIQDPY